MNAIKRYCGYWRPYYYAECAADLQGAAELLGGAGAHCTGAALRSFPSLHLPTSPYVSLRLPTSPYISPHLATSRHISPHLATSRRICAVSRRISPISRCIRWVENVLEECDAPEEFYYDAAQQAGLGLG